VLLAILQERAASVVLVSLLLLVPLVFILNALFRRYVKARGPSPRTSASC